MNDGKILKNNLVMNNKKSKKLRGINRKVRQGFSNLRQQLYDIERHTVVITGARVLEWLSEPLSLNEDTDFIWCTQDPNEPIRDVLIQIPNE